MTIGAKSFAKVRSRSDLGWSDPRLFFCARKKAGRVFIAGAVRDRWTGRTAFAQMVCQVPARCFLRGAWKMIFSACYASKQTNCFL